MILEPTTHALVFPGQGSQRQGMLDAVPAGPVLERLLDAAEALSGLELRRISREGSDIELADTRAAQPLLYLADWAWGTALLAHDLRPSGVAGHSLGEFAALAVAGVFSVEAGLELVVERSRLMAQAAADNLGRMAAVLGLDDATLRLLVDGFDGVWVANDNAPGQVVISGTHAGLEKAIHALMGAGARRVVPLSVAGAFHSPLMAGARDAFAEVLRHTAFADAVFPVYQNADPLPATGGDLIKARLADQICAPVRWNETMTEMRDRGIRLLVEAGPGGVLRGLARRVEGLSATSVEERGLDALVEEVTGRV